MTAYNPKELHHLQLQDEISAAWEKSCVTEQEYKQLKAAFPVLLYMPNAWIRIGLFLLTCIIVLFSFALFCLLFMSGNEMTFGGLSLFFAIVTYVILEWLIIREKKHYCSGVDDALMWLSGGFLVTSICLFAGDLISGLSLFSTLFAISLFFAIRFADRIMSVLAFLFLLGALFYSCLQAGAAGKAIAPFVLMGASYATYWLVNRQLNKTVSAWYLPGLQLVTICSLLTGYLAGNYYMVREVGSALLNEPLPPGQPMPLGWLFWLFSISIPLLYLFVGIRKKNRVLMNAGLLLVAAIVFTIRYYHSVLPLETAMTLGGLLLIGIAYALTRYLRQPRHGYTSEEIESSNSMESRQLEAIALAQTFNDKPSPDHSFDFGGGSGGGGGSTGDY